MEVVVRDFGIGKEADSVVIERLKGSKELELVVKISSPEAREVSQRTSHAIENAIANADLGMDSDYTLELVRRYQKSCKPLPDKAVGDFLALGEKPGPYAAFVREYGLLYEPIPGQDTTETESRKFRFPLGPIKGRAKRLRVLFNLRNLLAEGEGFEDLAKEAVKEAESLGFSFSYDPDLQLALHVSRNLAKVVPEIGYKGFALIPRFYCPDVLTGLYALLYKSIIDGSPWTICAHPRCGNSFQRPPGNPTKKHCSNRCQEAHKQAKYRQAKKKRSVIAGRL